jgi:hypothetical protein
MALAAFVGCCIATVFLLLLFGYMIVDGDGR